MRSESKWGSLTKRDYLFFAKVGFFGLLLFHSSSVIAQTIIPDQTVSAQSLLQSSTPSPSTGTSGEPAQANGPALTIGSQGGAYQESQARAFFTAYENEKNITLRVLSHNAENTFKRGFEPFDVVDLPRDVALKACADGLLEKLTFEDVLEPAARSDFPGAANTTSDECSIPNTAWSAVFLYDRRAFEKRIPTSVQDVFDASRFPGKRGFIKNPRYILEMALRADGVASGEIYNALNTAEGLKRAFTRLERIKGQIVWFDKPSDALKSLSQKQISFALAFNGQAFFSIVRDRLPAGIIWNGQVLSFNVWAIPKTSRNPVQARDFVKFALAPQRLAQQTKWFPYGPARLSSVAFVGKHADITMEMLPYLPTSPANLKDAILFDDAFWARNETSLQERFSDWIAGKIDPAGLPVSNASDTTRSR